MNLPTSKLNAAELESKDAVAAPNKTPRGRRKAPAAAWLAKTVASPASGPRVFASHAAAGAFTIFTQLLETLNSTALILKLAVFTAPRVPLLVLCTLGTLHNTHAERLVSGSPQVTEFLFQMGRGAHIVGTPLFSHYPPAASDIETTGSLFEPNVEKIVSLKPDWVILDRHNYSTELEGTLESLSIRTFLLDTFTVEGLLQGGETLAETVFGQTSVPAIRNARRCLDAWKARRRGHPQSYIAFVWLDPPIAFGARSFFSDLLRQIGWKNQVPSEIRTSFPVISMEWLFVHPAERVFVLTSESAPFPGLSDAQVVDPDLFMRASLTPLKHLHLLVGELAGNKPHPSVARPEICRAI